MQFDLAVLAGDGVGPEVTNEAIKVLQAVGKKFGHNFNLYHGLIGGIAIDEQGMALASETLKMCRNCDAVLLCYCEKNKSQRRKDAETQRKLCAFEPLR